MAVLNYLVKKYKTKYIPPTKEEKEF